MSEYYTFIFPIAEIKQLIEQRTSNLGKMRGSETEPHLLNRLSLTDGESFLSNEWLEEAAGETYDWIKAFGRNVKDAFRIYPDGDLVTIKENHGAHLEVGGSRVGLIHKQEIPAANVHIIHNSAQSDEQSNITAFTVNVNLPSAVNVKVGEAAEVYYQVLVNYTEGVNDAPIENKKQYIISKSISADAAESSLQFVVQMTTLLGDMTVKSIDGVEVAITKAVPVHFTLKKGDYIHLLNADGTQMYGLVGADYDSDTDLPIFATPLAGDVRNAIVFTVDLPDWQDRNMLPMVERNLKDALSYFVIWRWFEVVYPQEAQPFHERFEEKAHQAQLGLNTENHTLQRKSTWL